MADRALMWFWHFAFILAIVAGIVDADSRYLLHAGITALMGFWLGRVTS